MRVPITAINLNHVKFHSLAQKLAEIHDLLAAWRGIGPSILSLWRSRRLERRVQRQLLVVLLFFAACAILQILVPATVTVQTAEWTIPLTLRVTQRPELTDADFSFLEPEVVDNHPLTTIGYLPNALYDTNSLVGMPPGVESG